MKRPTLTIGIPAHNEEANITHLLSDILEQKSIRADLVEILVISDGSTDKTGNLVRMFADKRVRVTICKERKGKALRQNQIITKAKGDILVLLDADIVMSDPLFLETLVRPIVAKQADMTSAAIKELPPRTFFESVLDMSMQLKDMLFTSWKNGNNLYTCHGPARAFSRAMFSGLYFPLNEGEDMYSYLSCVARGFRYQYVKQASVNYRLPSTFSDHKRQSVRYLRAQQKYKAIFGSEFFDNEIAIPRGAYWRGFVKSLPILLTHPFHVVVYLGTLFAVKYSSRILETSEELWQVASSKIIRA